MFLGPIKAVHETHTEVLPVRDGVGEKLRGTAPHILPSPTQVGRKRYLKLILPLE